MNVDIAVPFNPLAAFGLAKANIELSLRTGRLLQEYAQQWLELASRAGKDGLAESDAEIADLSRTPDWPSLASLPTESFWRQIQQRYGDLEAAAQIAVAAQTTFAHGLQQALHDWQTSAAAVVGGNAFPAESAQPFDDILKYWNNSLASLSSIPAFGEVPAFGAAPKAAGRKKGSRE